MGAELPSPARPLRPVATYSIVAYDPASGQMGVAVQSHWFSVGSIVTWAEAGIGAVATQSFVEPAYGPLGLQLLRAGKTAPQALNALLTADDHEDVRQVAMVDAQGNVAVHTGAKCIAAAGHQQGKNYSCQANMMEKNTVWAAMAKAFESTPGELVDRLLAALLAAEKEGGDIRGRQSAAILVVNNKVSGTPWKNRVYRPARRGPSPALAGIAAADHHRQGLQPHEQGRRSADREQRQRRAGRIRRGHGHLSRQPGNGFLAGGHHGRVRDRWKKACPFSKKCSPWTGAGRNF